MTSPIVAGNRPLCVPLEAGKNYFFCVCGRSQAQPFCDGSHKGSGLEPLKFSVSETADYWLCCCKHTATRPFCDGHHKQFADSDVGQEGRDGSDT
ncbi:CDGSH iron-sulfur domain-containing protein [Microbulbifer hainanensis]|uniref:CDGSH iron-sulfur domain-containing protein n=1 Tax=Microbulbifer hainanensis TaxID=2735675 RepID=UPI001865C612|nr:CDGSH iron-sulfur domain-containing protein [Microbulbifer hainanensis]